MIESKSDESQVRSSGRTGRRGVHHVVFVSKFDLECPLSGNMRQVKFQLPPARNPGLIPSIVRNLWKVRSATVVFISNPRGAELLFLFAAKLLYGARLRTVTFDLILRAPKTRWELLLARFKRGLLGKVDVFICIHKDVSGYTRNYGVRPDRCEYVPFKPNNWDLVDGLSVRDGDYVVALGASQRDYGLLIEAVRDLEIPVKIILPRVSIKMHNAEIGTSAFPEHVEHVETRVDRMQWNRYIADSRLVVVPILPGVIQPAGISVYLEAMTLGKPVVVTRGASTEGILDEQLAVLVQPGDAQELGAAIVEVWNNAALRRSLGNAAKVYARSLGDHKRLIADIRGIIGRKCLGGAPGKGENTT